MGYTVSLASSASQAEGNPGGTAASFVFNLTRDAGDANETAYSYEIRHADTLLSEGGADFTGTAFTWAPGVLTTTVTLTAVADTVAEANEGFVVWFFRDAVGHQRFNDGLSFSPTSTITLTNDDAGPPVFSSSATVNAAENGTAAGTVAATGNGTVTYALSGVGLVAGADQGQFSIDANTGVLTFLANNDYETPDDVGGDRIYNVTVRATAAGQSTDQAVAVTLTNVNEAPEITTNGGLDVALGVAENTTTAFATLGATSGPGANEPSDSVTWSISGGPDASFFTIDASSGDLRFAANPNFEAARSNIYNVQLRATNSGNLSDTINYTVTVNDLVEAPVITSNGGGVFAFVLVPENTATATAIATVVATDDDSAAPTYSIDPVTGGDDRARFAINATTGVLTFVASPNFEAPTDVGADNTYVVNVTATSGALTDVQTINVTVTNVIETGVPSDLPSAGGGGGGGPVVPPPPVNVNDLLTGTAGTDSRAGGEGNDTINGDAGDDQLDGDNGGDLVFGGQGNDFIRGLNDNDTVYGDEGADTVNGNLGDDVVDGGSGDDTVYGGQGQDTVYGGEGNDVYVNGNIGNDIVHGGAGDDSVYGGQNSDTVYGDAGNDRVTGDLGNDILFGNAGADRFAMLNTGGDDWVADWNFAEGDRIQLANGQAYTVSNVGGQAFISLGPTAGIGLAGVSFSSFSSDWIIFGA